MLRTLGFLFLLLAIAPIWAQQQPPADADIASLLRSLSSNTPSGNPPAGEQLAERFSTAPLAEIEASLPTLITLSESADDHTRFGSIVALFGLGSRQATDPPGAIDTTGIKLLVPYISRLAPRLSDPATSGIAAYVFNSLAMLHPVPQEIFPALNQVLNDPASTMPGPSSIRADASARNPFGPSVVFILLSAGATYHNDPVTHITEGQSSPEAQAAILKFLHRPDQTCSSLANTIHNMAIAQPQNPELNADLLRFLDSPDPTVRMELVHNLTRLTFPAKDFEVAKARLTKMSFDISTSPEFRTEIAKILPCWTNDRHHLCN
jgi:hypothetical protein